jgi:hypothetical protein
MGSLSHRGLCCHVPVMKETLVMHGDRGESILCTDSRMQMQHINQADAASSEDTGETAKKKPQPRGRGF